MGVVAQYSPAGRVRRRPAAASEGAHADRAPGGRVIVSGQDVADRQPAAMVNLAIKTFGDLPVLVNNAGILRDRTLAHMSVWLAQADCPATSQGSHIGGSRLYVFAVPTIAGRLEARGRCTLEDLDRELLGRLVRPLELDDLLGDR